MRTTLVLSDDAYELAKAIARERRIGLGKAISELIVDYYRGPVGGKVKIEIEGGLPVVHFGRVVTNEEVAATLEEDDYGKHDA